MPYCIIKISIYSHRQSQHDVKYKKVMYCPGILLYYSCILTHCSCIVLKCLFSDVETWLQEDKKLSDILPDTKQLKSEAINLWLSIKYVESRFNRVQPFTHVV